MQAVTGRVFERPEFLECEAHAKGNEEGEDRGDEVVDADDVGEKVECYQIDREGKSAREHKAHELPVLLKELRQCFRHELSEERTILF
ncbi:hypothetical protein A3A40_02545 [Candidatus Kaiserbacteria bacterium RIFCSPLOWO2_01_FULL_54_20]|uniref:Uncharacterized protein n=1 Tax=Candidatus Kaiserbacteria bacterium RIFCSPLOWO2_01_FULL_54_20 TaxID=1798513 RepID=A0A1F6EJQ8_9BACT|nr:MAG: hypothetical protein A3A40_02545 [Candidatus Kaiserbacteria bacterium RIFCSPLOWO2_01_FULL_54_20]